MNKTLREIIFPYGPDKPHASDGILLAVRLVFGGLMTVHGIQKIAAFSMLSQSFPDPFGWGSGLALTLAIFAEFLCALGVLTGFLFRLALIPLIFNMCVAVSVMASGGWNALEYPLLYLLMYVMMLVAGPGRLSLDAVVCRKFRL